MSPVLTIPISLASLTSLVCGSAHPVKSGIRMQNNVPYVFDMGIKRKRTWIFDESDYQIMMDVPRLIRVTPKTVQQKLKLILTFS